MNIIKIIQPALPAYRKDFFQKLSDKFPDRLEILYSESTLNAPHQIKCARVIGGDVHLIGGLLWQRRICNLPLRPDDILVISGNFRYLSTLVLLVRARAIGAKTIVWGQYRSSTSRDWRMKIRLWLLGMGDALLFYTDAEIAMYRANIGRKDGRPIAALNNGINTGPIALYRTPYVAADRDRAIFFVGRLTHKANLSLLLSAMAHPSLERVILHVVGTSETEKMLRAEADKLGISERIVWHGSTSDEAVIATVANRCRLFVYPGEVGLSLIHAMAYGLPSVVHDDPRRHMPEIAAFRNGETGCVFTKNDPESLARTIAELVNATDELQRFSDRCLEITENDYNTSSMAKRFIDFVEHIDAEEKAAL